MYYVGHELNHALYSEVGGIGCLCLPNNNNNNNNNNDKFIATLASELYRTMSSVGFVFIFSVFCYQ